MRLRGRYGREIIQKIGQRVPAIEIVEQGLHRHARPGKARRSAHDLGINGNLSGLVQQELRWHMHDSVVL
jgi:hypothetical protein